jgi:hypothetical protein
MKLSYITAIAPYRDWELRSRVCFLESMTVFKSLAISRLSRSYIRALMAKQLVKLSRAKIGIALV